MTSEPAEPATRASSTSLRVLFITRKWPPAVGGMETYSRDLTKELKSAVDLDVLALPGNADGTPPGPLALFLFLARAAWLLMRRGRSWDLVHLGDFVLFPLAWLHATVSPSTSRVITVHGLDVIFGNRQGWKPGLYRHFISWARRRRDCLSAIIVNSRNTGRLVEKAGLGESAVIPLGVRLDPAGGAEALPVDPSDRYVLFVGRLVRRKGAAWFASAVLPQLPEDVRFKVVGKTWDPAEEQALRRAVRVDRLGYVSDQELVRLRAGAVAVVQPNIPIAGEQDVEGFGITALEAAVGGAPLIAANLEGISDAVVDGVTGFLVEPQQPEAWAEKIRELLHWVPEQRNAFQEAARARVARDFSWTRVAHDTLAVYRVASNCAPGRLGKAADPTLAQDTKRADYNRVAAHSYRTLAGEESGHHHPRPTPGGFPPATCVHTDANQNAFRPMKIWIPYIRGGSGTDVFTDILANVLHQGGAEVVVQPFDHRWQYTPSALSRVTAPPGTKVVIANTWNAFAFRRPGARVVAIEHLFVLDPALRPYKSVPQMIFHRTLVRMFELATLKAADTVVAVSRYGARTYAEGLQCKPPIVIYNGVDTEFLTPAPTGKEPLAGRPFRLLFVGNLITRKGADLLAPIMQSLGAGFELSYTAGSRTDNPLPTVKHARRLGRLDHRGLRDEYRRADAVLFPTRLEGFGYAAAEGMACGTPIIGSRSSSLPEIIDDYVTGRLCEVDHIEAFSRAIRELADNPEKLAQMGAAARTTATSRFTLARMGADYAALIDEPPFP